MHAKVHAEAFSWHKRAVHSDVHAQGGAGDTHHNTQTSDAAKVMNIGWHGAVPVIRTCKTCTQAARTSDAARLFYRAVLQQEHRGLPDTHPHA